MKRKILPGGQPPPPSFLLEAVGDFKNINILECAYYCIKCHIEADHIEIDRIIMECRKLSASQILDLFKDEPSDLKMQKNLEERRDALEELQKIVADGGANERISKLEVRIKELEAALEIKDSALDKLKTMISNLQGELKQKDAVRMSQIELLAMRNVELEKELSQLKANKSIATT